MKPSGGNWPALTDIHTLVFDFDGVFTDNKVYVQDDGRESVRCDRSDGLAFDMLRNYCQRNSAALDYFILSTERNPVVSARAKKLRLRCEQAVGDKFAFLKDYLAQRYPQRPNPFSGVVYFGNDLNDLAVLTHAGFSIVPADAHERVRQAASVVLPKNGGHGFVRAAIERLLNIDHLSLEEIHELVCNR